jgi:ankyrin repeat protein
MKIAIGIVLGIIIIALALFLLAKYEPELKERAERKRDKKFDSAVRRGDIAAVEQMLEKYGALLSLQRGMEEATMQGEIEMMKFLIEKGADVNKYRSGAAPPLVLAMVGRVPIRKYATDPELAKEAREAGLIKDAATAKADLAKAIELVNFLIGQGADPNLGDERGRTVMQHVEASGWIVPEEIKEILKKAGSK